jgi:hypothetical protein
MTVGNWQESMMLTEQRRVSDQVAMGPSGVEAQS